MDVDLDRLVERQPVGWALVLGTFADFERPVERRLRHRQGLRGGDADPRRGTLVGPTGHRDRRRHSRRRWPDPAAEQHLVLPRLHPQAATAARHRTQERLSAARRGRRPGRQQARFLDHRCLRVRPANRARRGQQHDQHRQAARPKPRHGLLPLPDLHQPLLATRSLGRPTHPTKRRFHSEDSIGPTETPNRTRLADSAQPRQIPDNRQARHNPQAGRLLPVLWLGGTGFEDLSRSGLNH